MSFAIAQDPRPSAAATADSFIRQSHERHLADRREWRTLLHWRPNVWRHWRSDIDDPRFFLATHGRDDAQSELDATLRAFFVAAPPPDADTQEHAQCRFPARLAWLRQELGGNASDWPLIPCPRFEEWRQRLNADGATLVFASYYFSNPASMYGHTFLRLNRPESDPTHNDHLLDYTINFAADADAREGPLYAVKGLAGGYRGRFSTMPYYMKVQEYTHLDSRDLWEYPLHLTSPQMERLVRHAWELGQASMRYFFLNKNCSYQLMPLLEVADPRRHLSDSFWLKTVPVDTLRVVRQAEGLADSGDRRASAWHRLIQERSALDPTEIALVEALAVVRSPSAFAQALRNLDALADQRQALLLDTAYDLYRWRYGYSRDMPERLLIRDQALLARRSQVPLASQKLATGSAEDSAAVSPDVSHASGRLGLIHGFSSRSQFQEIDIRPALHAADDPSRGFLPGSTLEMFRTRLRWDDRRSTAYVQDFSLIHLVSLPDWDPWGRKPAWTLKAGVHTAPELNRDNENSLITDIRFGPGLSRRFLLAIPIQAYALALADGGVGHAIGRGRIGNGVSAGLLVEASPWLRCRFGADHVHYWVGAPDSTTHLEIVPSISVHPRLDLRVHMERWNEAKEIRVGLFFFI